MRLFSETFDIKIQGLVTATWWGPVTVIQFLLWLIFVKRTCRVGRSVGRSVVAEKFFNFQTAEIRVNVTKEFYFVYFFDGQKDKPFSRIDGS